MQVLLSAYTFNYVIILELGTTFTYYSLLFVLLTTLVPLIVHSKYCLFDMTCECLVHIWDPGLRALLDVRCSKATSETEESRS